VDLVGELAAGIAGCNSLGGSWPLYPLYDDDMPRANMNVEGGARRSWPQLGDLDGH
jgi:hypothetical protein